MDRFSFRDLRDIHRNKTQITNRFRVGGSTYYTNRQGLWKFELAWTQAILSVVPEGRHYDNAFYFTIQSGLHLQLGNLKSAADSLFCAVQFLSFMPKVPCRGILDMVREILDFLPREDNEVTWHTYKWVFANFTGNKKQLPPQSKNCFALSLFKRQLSSVS